MTNTRQALILEIVREKGSASIEHLAEHFAVTQQTIRRIVNQLCEQGSLRRIHVLIRRRQIVAIDGPGRGTRASR